MMQRLVAERLPGIATAPSVHRRAVSRQCMRDIAGEMAKMDLRQKTILRLEGRALSKSIAQKNEEMIVDVFGPLFAMPN